MKFLKRNYHWIIIFIVFLEMIIYGGIYNSATIFTIPMSEDLNISRGTLSLLMTTKNISSFIGSLATAFLLRRFGYRKCAVGFLILTGASMFLLASAATLGMVAVGFALSGLSFGVCCTTGAVWIIKKWFSKHQGLLLGFVSMATGVGGTIMSAILTEVIVVSSWRYAYGLAALLNLTVALLYIFLRNDPKEMQLAPYGEDGPTLGGKQKGKSRAVYVGDSYQELKRKPQFYLMMTCVLLLSCSAYLTLNIVVPHMQDSGFSPTDATYYYGILLIMLSVGKLLWGWFSDRYSCLVMAVSCVALITVGQVILMLVGTNTALAWTGAILYGIGLPTTTIVIPILTLHFFGYRSYDSATSFFLALVPLSNTFSLPVSNWIHDYFGSYRLSFLIAIGMHLLLIVLFFVLNTICNREKKREAAVK